MAYVLENRTSMNRGFTEGGKTHDNRPDHEMARPIISVEPKSSLIDDKVRILVCGLKPKQTVTLEAKLLSDKGELFQSHAHFIADKDGEVDVCRDSSLGGSYSGVSPMGLLWSMKPAPGQRKGVRLTKSDVTLVLMAI